MILRERAAPRDAMMKITQMLQACQPSPEIDEAQLVALAPVWILEPLDLVARPVQIGAVLVVECFALRREQIGFRKNVRHRMTSTNVAAK